MVPGAWNQVLELGRCPPGEVGRISYHRDLLIARCGSGRQLHQGLRRLVELSEGRADRQLATHSSCQCKRQGGLPDAKMGTSKR